MTVELGHPDYAELQTIREAIERRLPGDESIESQFGTVVANAVDYVVDPVRTGRTRINELDNVEKTIIGLKVEHFLRDWLGLPSGIRDLDIDGHPVDVKNTVRSNWMIPPETANEARELGEDPGGICLLVKIDEDSNRCWLGLFRSRPHYLNRPNRDGKRSIAAEAMNNIMWLVEGRPYVQSRFAGLDMLRFRQIRAIRGGNNRVHAFFRENLGRPVHRTVVLALLHDQLDPMKRLRWNGGAKARLWENRTVLLSGAYFRTLAQRLHGVTLARDEFVSFELTDEAIAIAEQSNYLAEEGADS
jgi:hypothetical protein